MVFVSNSKKRRTHVEVRAAREGMLPNIEQDDDNEREVSVDSSRDCNRPYEDIKELQPHKQGCVQHARVCFQTLSWITPKKTHRLIQ